MIAKARNGEPRRRLGGEAARIERREQRRDAPPLEGPEQTFPMPVAPIAEHHDGRTGGTLTDIDLGEGAGQHGGVDMARLEALASLERRYRHLGG